MSTSDLPTDSKIDALVVRFPRLFKGRHPRVWSDLPQGWVELTHRLFADLDTMLNDDEAARFEIVQIKEKFAGLRVYWSLGEEMTLVLDLRSTHSSQRIEKVPDAPTALSDRIRALVAQAAEQAATTCQHCGNGGAERNGFGYYVTLCGPCRMRADVKEPE